MGGTTRVVKSCATTASRQWETPTWVAVCDDGATRDGNHCNAGELRRSALSRFRPATADTNCADLAPSRASLRLLLQVQRRNNDWTIAVLLKSHRLYFKNNDLAFSLVTVPPGDVMIKGQIQQEGSDSCVSYADDT